MFKLKDKLMDVDRDGGPSPGFCPRGEFGSMKEKPLINSKEWWSEIFDPDFVKILVGLLLMFLTSGLIIYII